MVKLEVTPAAAFTEYKEINFQGLYLHRRWDSQQSPNEARVVDGKRRANIGIGGGAITAYNWEVYDGLPGPYANLVARAQGLHVRAEAYVSCFTLVFVDERFKESTLEVRGRYFKDWAVVGGTGQFAMANGVIYSRMYGESKWGEDIRELTIRAFCPQLNGTRPPTIKIGPCGGSGGSQMDITEAPRRLESITVYTGWVVDSIAFSYIDNSGQKGSSGRWGGSGGQPHDPIELAESEVVTEVSGTVASFEGETVLCSIKFVTNLNKTHGPWGDGQGAIGDKLHHHQIRDKAPFTIPVPPGSAIVGFFARAGAYLNAIGVHVRPL